MERKIGGPLENAAASNRYVDVMVRGMRLQRAIGGGVGRAVGGAAEKVLRVANIPTRSDVRRINRQLAVLTSEVRALTDDQREAREAARRRGGEAARRRGGEAARQRGEARPRHPPDAGGRA